MPKRAIVQVDAPAERAGVGWQVNFETPSASVVKQARVACMNEWFMDACAKTCTLRVRSIALYALERASAYACTCQYMRACMYI